MEKKHTHHDSPSLLSSRRGDSWVTRSVARVTGSGTVSEFLQPVTAVLQVFTDLLTTICQILCSLVSQTQSLKIFIILINFLS
jgi:hypothetical protein